jgi:hypothetical protein
MAFWLGLLGSNAQETILDSYEAHFENPRELVYVHLNKTKFYEGEMIGFKAYVFDKNSKQLSKNTRNLYCVISDMDNNAIKSSMILVEDGVANSTMDIDTSFVPGKYIFKAYTNWMRNFDEPNYFSAIVEISNFETIVDSKPQSAEVEPDIQVLPEGGHLLQDVPNGIGIVTKDQFGKGLKDARAYLLDGTNDTINSFSLNRFGIGKTLLIPEAQVNYKVLVKYGYTFYEAEVPPAKPIGVAMRLLDSEEKTYIALTTNPQSQKIFKDKPFTVAIHNGGEITLQEFDFNESASINIQLDDKQLFTGINIITIFDPNERPILERLYFNHNGINQILTGNANLTALKDSTMVQLPLINGSNKSFNSVSVSILPSETKSYNPQDNILSKLFLRPYVRGEIEDVAYYFSQVGEKKKHELNNLLLTQGWSSYDWNDIFRTPGIPIHRFEQGIDFNVSINNKRASSYIIEGMARSKPILFDLPSDENSFEGKGLYPKSNERFVLSAVSENGSVFKPGAVVNFSPESIPQLEIEPIAYNLKPDGGTLLYGDAGLDPIIKDEVTLLDEVTLKAQLNEQRLDKLQKQYSGFGDVQIVDDVDAASNMTFAQWITKFGYTTTENINGPLVGKPLFSIVQNRNRWPVLIFFDGVPLRDSSLDILYNLLIHNIDYVIMDKTGFSAPFGGQTGIIRIKTNNNIRSSGSLFTGRLVKDFELTFTTNKTFYTPKYIDYNNAFFRDYGVVGWTANATITDNGELELVLPNKYKGEVSLFIEGISGDNGFISEVKTLQLN